MGFINRRPDPPKQLVTPSDLIPDNHLVAGEVDHLEHEAIAKAVADLAFSAQPPVNIALFGPWGSGKSSVYSMVEERLEALDGERVAVVRYDAWKYGGADLKRNFIASVAEDLHFEEDDFTTNLHRDAETGRLDLWKWATENRGAIGTGVLFAFALAALWIGGTALLSVLFTDKSLATAIETFAPVAGTVFGLALVAFVAGPKALESASIRVTAAAPTTDDAFADRFAKLVKKLGESTPPVKRLVVFVDELDRCTPADVISTLVDLKTFLNNESCVFIVAADRDVIERSLRETKQHARSTKGEDPYYATPGEFLDKIFQHQLQLPPLRARTLTRFARKLVDPAKPGLWKELHDHSVEGFETAIFALVPAHVASPRRVKVLMNNFATNARTAQARGVPWLDRAPELAALTVLQTEFPAVAEDLVRIPRLPAYLRGDQVSEVDEINEVIRRHGGPFNRKRATGPAAVTAEPRGPEGNDPADTPALQPSVSGDIITNDEYDRAHAAEAARLLQDRLAAYLAKIRQAGVEDPRPDLLYLKTVELEGIDDPHLGDLIDMAADTVPDTIVEAFTGQPRLGIASAVGLLTSQSDDATAVERAFILESACRLLELIDYDDLGNEGTGIAASILSWVETPSWPPGATPGALAVATRTGNQQAATRLTRSLSATNDSLLSSALVAAYPHGAGDTRDAFADLLMENYRNGGGCFPEALAHLREADAFEVWDRLSAQVIRYLEAVEEPPPAEEDDEPAPSDAPVAADEAADGTKRYTGRGRARLDTLINRASATADPRGNTRLLSAILESAQASKSPPILDEALVQATNLFPSFEDPSIVQHHVLTGIASNRGNWIEWFKLRNERHPATMEEDAALAVEILNNFMLPKAADEEEWTDTASNAARWLTELVAEADLDSVARATATQLKAIGWTDPGEDGEATEGTAASPTAGTRTITPSIRDLLRRFLHEYVRDVAHLLGADRAAGIVVDDIMVGCRGVELDEESMALLEMLIGMLDSRAAATLSNELDTYQAGASEKIEVALLKTYARSIARLEPLTAAQLDFVDDAGPSTKLMTAWLAESPAPNDVVALAAQATFRADTLSPYAKSVTTEERTAIWLALEAGAAKNAVLQAVGRHGVDQRAVEALAERITDTESKQDERSAAAERLRTATLQATLTSAKSEPPQATDAAVKATSGIAETLLESGGAANARIAADLVLWAGAPGHGHVGRLRDLFTGAVSKHEFFKRGPLAKQLLDMGLLPEKKGLLEALFGGSKKK